MRLQGGCVRLQGGCMCRWLQGPAVPVRMGGSRSTRCRQPLSSAALPSHMASSTSM